MTQSHRHQLRWLVASVVTALCAVAALAGARLLSRSSPASASPDALFTEVAQSSGLQFVYKRNPDNIRQTVAPGVAFWDYDGDGWLDVFLVGQKHATDSGGGKLFRNRGDGTFEDRTETSGLGIAGYWMGCATGDYDNDGRVDLLLTGYEDRRLFRNMGGGRFADVTLGSGLEVRAPAEWSTAAGFSDLVLGRYVYFTREVVERQTEQWWTPERFRAQKPSVFLNVGGGRFRDVTRAYGLTDSNGKTLGVAFADANGDNYPDIYLANDTAPCDLYLSQGGPKYVNRGLASGTAYNFNGGTQAGMGADWGDYSGDGRPDLVVTTFEREPMSLYENEGNGFFKHVSFSSGVGEPSIPVVGWGTRFLDFDLDGFLDLACVSGHVRPDAVAGRDGAGFSQRPLLFRGLPNGRFVLVENSPLGLEMVARGLAAGDFNNDGRPDLLIGSMEGSPRLLAGKSSEGNWVGFRLVGSRSNRMALGARLRLSAGGRVQVREVSTAGSYLSGQDPRLLFGLGTASSIDFVEIEWPSGLRERRESPQPGQYHSYVEPNRSSKAL